MSDPRQTTIHTFWAPRHLLLVVLATVWLLGAGCAGSDDDSTSPESTTTNPPASTQTTATDSPTSAIEATTTTTETTAPASTLPGVPFEGFASSGDILAVMGVAHDDVLNVRMAPGADQPIITTLAPTAADVIATGLARQIPNSIWYEVTANSVTGWVSARFVGFTGPTDDVTAAYLAASSQADAETITDLGLIVAESFISEEPGSFVVQSVAADVGDLAEVTFDVIGLGDDSIAGYRLHVFATPDENGFVLKSIERTTFCGRGLAGEICV